MSDPLKRTDRPSSSRQWGVAHATTASAVVMEESDQAAQTPLGALRDDWPCGRQSSQATEVARRSALRTAVSRASASSRAHGYG